MKNISIAGGDTAKPITLQKRVRKVLDELAAEDAPILFLDCGCGAGDYVEEFAKHGLVTQGVEFLTDKVQLARDRGLGPDRVAQGDLQKLSIESGRFDATLFNEVLEHVPDDHAALREAHRVLKPGGHLFIFSPNRFYPFESHGVYLKGSNKKLPVWIPLIPWLPIPVGERIFRYWARNYWPSELRANVRNANFKIISTSYTWQTFEGISGKQALLIRILRPMLRLVANGFERTPLIRCFGVSQFIHAVKLP